MRGSIRNSGDAMLNANLALFLGLCALGLAGTGCRPPRPLEDAEGTLQFVVRSVEDVGGAVPQGSFEVRGIDNDERARVGIGSSTARTLRLRLPAGAYSVAWQPSSSPGSRAVPARAPASAEPSQIVVVSPESSATVDVFVAAQSAPGSLASAHGSTL